MPDRAALVLCGGHSKRMGADKASLPFGEETLLERVVRRIEDAVDEIWLVAREGQELHLDLPVARDPAEGLGPLAGLAAGLRAMSAPRAFLVSCDVPLIEPAMVERIFDLCEGSSAGIPLVDGFHMTTTAVYDQKLLPVAEGLLQAGRLRPFFLVEAAGARIISEEELRAVDPTLQSLRDCDTPEDYAELLQLAGLAPAPSA
jgi:molybdopterin-guanine dinucleotide biosynthesis protein A